MRITWVLPFVRFTGGIRVVYEHTRGLLARGHEVTLVAPLPPLGPPWRAAWRSRLRDRVIDRWHTRSHETLRDYGLAGRLRTLPELDPALFPAADVILATAYITAPPVAAAPARCGARAYFVQSYEAFVPGTEAAVDATWRLPLEKIVIATWIARVARERFGQRVWGPIVNGVNFDLFHPRGRVDHEPPVLGMQYEVVPWKGLDDGMAAVAEARRQVPGLRLHLFGRPRLRHRLAAGDRYERNPTQARLGGIYRELDVLLSPSLIEGCQLPPMEAMASQCAVVATDVGGIPDYAVAGRTALVVAPGDRAAMADALVRLARQPDTRLKLARAGREHIEGFTWERATAELASVLARIRAGESA